MAESRPNFQCTQYAFAAAVRRPDSVPAPEGVAPDRMNLYHELIYHNVESFIASGFPVLHELLERHAWTALIRDFLARHHSTTPYFSGLPAEFLAYLRDERGDHPEDPPFLLELAHYEWLELAVSIEEGDTPPEDPALTADPLAQNLALSPAAWPQVYRYPVQRISRGFQPTAPPPEPTCLAVYRDREDQVRFLELNALTYRVLVLLAEQPGLTGLDYLRRISAELGRDDSAPLLAHGTELLRNLAARGVIGRA